MQIVAYLFGLGSLICFILTLVKTFQDKEKNGVLHGIIGLVTCGLWAFIWGWMNAGRWNHKNIMLAWTVCIIVGMVLNGMAMKDAMSGMGG